MDSTKKPRETFIDTARGISIILVVLWHTFGETLFYNGPLAFLRMPLFFFMAGIFAVSALYAPLRSTMRNKVGQLLWIFVIWTTILYMSRSGLKQLATKGSVDMYPVYSMFWNLPDIMWFVYALAIAFAMAALCSSLPRWPVLIVAFAFYIWSVAYGDWADPPYELKILRLLPAFFIAVFYAKPILNVSKTYAWTWPIHIAAFLPSAYFVYYSEWEKVGVVTALVSALGISFIMTFCYRYRSTPLARAIAIAGERSIYIFVMHGIVITYLREAASVLKVEDSKPLMVVIFVLAVIVPATAGKWIIDRFFPWLIKAPWISGPRKPHPVKTASLVAVYEKGDVASPQGEPALNHEPKS